MTEHDTEPVLLSSVEAGRKVKMVRMEAGRGLQLRLVGMGLMPGASIGVVRNDSSGPAVLAVHNSRVALGRGMVEKMIVTVLDEEDHQGRPGGES